MRENNYELASNEHIADTATAHHHDAGDHTSELQSNDAAPVAKRVFVEPSITLPVDVLKTTTAFLQGGSPGSATIP